MPEECENRPGMAREASVAALASVAASTSARSAASSASTRCWYQRVAAAAAPAPAARATTGRSHGGTPRRGASPSRGIGAGVVLVSLHCSTSNSRNL